MQLVLRKLGHNRNEKIVLAYVKNEFLDKSKNNMGPVPMTAMAKMRTGERVHVEFGTDYDQIIFNQAPGGDGLGSSVFQRITHLIGVKIA